MIAAVLRLDVALAAATSPIVAQPLLHVVLSLRLERLNTSARRTLKKPVSV